MKHITQIMAASIALVLVGCSKQHPPTVNSGAIDFGAVEVSSTDTSHFDADLGSNQVCVVQSFVTKDQTGAPVVVSSAKIAVRDAGGDHMLISFDATTNSPDQPVRFSNGTYTISLKPHIKP
jgi:hypothetical protein